VYNAPVTNKEDVNSALSYYCHVGDVVDAPLRATLALLAQIISEPCFDQLRTKEQLGYIVSSSQWQLVGSMGFRIVVQSEKDPVYLESRVDVFLEHMKGVLANMDDEEFQKQKQSLIDKKLEKLKNLGEEAGRFWNQIDLGYQDFTISTIALLCFDLNFADGSPV
jgi:insulysin